MNLEARDDPTEKAEPFKVTKQKKKRNLVPRCPEMELFFQKIKTLPVTEKATSKAKMSSLSLLVTAG